ncbi:DNA polymerase III subunit alpha [Halobacillus karajensis]|uniref:DNA polymerase III subunit alpha n=1 Tax=Halobacillus karajensis TaxID=195088 RepID=A0A024P7M9_9BACI|nr:DNA polymerase III subunit alpha [Halobacillus karajensis]CDQ18288.1 DNA polymerase III subunit alpha [Halobacillus karajensis]CDQ24641.1 DNA polymerase III subunit alpha [Halobacillus karajensis]CDQ29112.1 DNA polymerase III subunit alpha [Halobacillus karajensis]
MTFTHLNVQTGYSLMKSTVKIDPLVKTAKHVGFHAMAITDENTMSGAVTFYDKCIKMGIKPIIGLKTTVLDRSLPFPMILLAETNKGYQNLLQISTLVQTKGEDMTLDQLTNYRDGLIFVQLTSSSPWAETIANRMTEKLEDSRQRWLELLGADRFYLSIQDRDLHSERQLHTPLKEWVKENGMSVVAIGDVRYLHKEDADAYQCLQAINEGTRYSSDENEYHYYLKSQREMEDFFGEWWPETLDASSDIAAACNVELELDRQLLPSYPTPDQARSEDYLRELCEISLVKKYESERRVQAKERLAHELSIITSMGFSDYFLIVWDFISYARQKGIHAGPGRGSAAGSIVAYLLGITQIDPLEYNLLFERFLNPERISMPDIDIDFPDHRRDEVITYVAEKYGSDRVAQICTFGTFAARSVLRELFKVLKIDENDASFILHHIPKTTSISLVDLVKDSEELKSYIRNSDRLKLLFRVAAKLEGLPRHISTHAAGVVLSEHALVNYTALLNSQGPVALTQFAMGDLEKIGLLKIDFLGLRNLSFLEQMERKVKRYQNKSFSIDQIPLDDSSTFRLLKEGRTNGVFQLESQGMKNVLMRLKPNHFEDVVAVNALYRPGPMEYIPVYIDRKNKRKNIEYPHPDLKPILSHTFGVLVYQEQIMQVAQYVAGYSLGQADLLRRAVSKKQGEVLENERLKFVNGCNRKGYDDSVAHQLFDWIVKFSNYGFNRSHAVAYSMISYRLAYMKAHYPSYFLAELMNAHLGDKDKMTIYIREARDMGVKVNAPSVNRSHILSQNDSGDIRIGLTAIKGVGYQAAQSILEERSKGQFRNLNDFCLRTDGKIVSRKVIEALVLAGAFDELHQNRASVLASIDQALEQGELFKEFQDQPGFFGNELDMEMIHVEPFPPLKRLSMEKEVLGSYMSQHPLAHQRGRLNESGILSILQAHRVPPKRKVEVACVIDGVREIRTKRGDPMAFLTISDESTEMDAVLFPETYRNVKVWMQEQMLVYLAGRVEERNGQKQLIIDHATPFAQEGTEQHEKRRLFIKVSKENEHYSIEKLKKLAEYFPGNTPVFIFRSEDRGTYKLDNDYSLSLSKKTLNKLYEFFGETSVAVRPIKNGE